MWAQYASGDSEWCSTAPMPPPKGMRTVTGSLHRAPRPVRHLGEVGDDLLERRVGEPVELHLRHRPVAVHRQADGRADDRRTRPAGCRSTRPSPKRSCSPSVTRNTPPSLPTSSPKIRTRSSASIASRRAAVDGLRHGDRHDATSPSPAASSSARSCSRWRIEVAGVVDVDVVEQLHRVAVRRVVDGWRGGPWPRPCRPGRTPLSRSSSWRPRIARKLRIRAIGSVSAAAVEFVLRAVPRRVVGGGVRLHPVGHRLDEGRPLTAPGASTARLATA